MIVYILRIDGDADSVWYNLWQAKFEAIFKLNNGSVLSKVTSIDWQERHFLGKETPVLEAQINSLKLMIIPYETNSDKVWFIYTQACARGVACHSLEFAKTYLGSEVLTDWKWSANQQAWLAIIEDRLLNSPEIGRIYEKEIRGVPEYDAT